MVPPSMRDELAGVASAADLTEDQKAALSTVAPVVKDRMQRSGSGLIGFQPVNGFSNCWRMVIAGAKEALTNDGIGQRPLYIKFYIAMIVMLPLGDMAVLLPHPPLP